MTIGQRLYTYLPESWQNKMLSRVISSGKWQQIPTFQMLFKSFEIMGGDHADILEVFTTSRDMGPTFYENCRTVAKRRESVAENHLSDPAQARQEYQKALILYFLADWVSFAEDQIARNYEDILRVSAQVDALGIPRTEKVFFPWTKGQIAGRFRVPEDDDPEKQFPLVIILQGNDTVKETFLFLEDELLKNDYATLTVDQPGWGESRQTGNIFERAEDSGRLADACLEFIKTQSNIDINRLCLMGFSNGGTWVVQLAGTRSYFKVLVAVGGAIYKLEESIKRAPAMQKRQAVKHFGCEKNEILGKVHDLKLAETLQNITIQCLLVHGEKDTLVPVKLVQEASQLISGPVELRIVPGGDHMMTNTLMQIEVPFIENWLKTHL